ncbi:MAG: hypothetical protein IJF96_01385 [Firmicutes bacterium]|nr:hypothetical protein [Bacillota bacterium]
MKKTRLLLMVTALIVCMSGQSFAMEEPEAGSAADPAQAETQTEAQAETQTEAQTEAQTGAQAETRTGTNAEVQPAGTAETRTTAPAKSRADTEPLGAAPKEEAQPEMREVKVYRSCVITSIDSREGRIMVNWKRRSSGEGYCIYRRELGEETWTRVKKVNVNTVLQYRDEDIVNGAVYEYKVLKYNTIETDEETVSGSDPSRIGNTRAAVYTYLEAPKEFKYKKHESSISLRWAENPDAEKYIVMYSRNSLFRNAGTRQVEGTRCEIKGLDTSKTYYMKVRCVQGEALSDWMYSSNYYKQRTAGVKYIKVYRKIKKNGKTKRMKLRLDVRIAAKQKLHGYDTVQGAASDGNYSYTILLNKKNGYCRIVKMKGGTSKVVRVSKVMYLGHGNGMAYNPDRKILVVAHGKATKGVLSVVRARDLKYMKKVRIKYGKSLTGYNGDDLHGIKTYSGVSYLPGKKQYVLTPNEKVAAVYLDRDFNPVRYQTLYYKFPNQTQGTHAEGELLFRSASPKGSGPDNAFFIYNTFGVFLKKIKIPVAGELESLYFVGNKLFGAIYRSRYVTRTKIVKKYYYVKKHGRYVKKHGKRIRRVRKKRVKYRIFYRDSYVIRISNY